MGNLCKFPSNKDLDIISFDKLEKDSPRKKIRINEIKKEIMDIPIFERNKIAMQKYNDYINNKKKNNQKKDFIEEYIEINTLLLMNDTDKDIVSLYLNFIKDNELSIKNQGLKSFNEEIKKYKLLFTVEEMDKIEKGIKNESEKTKFILILKKLMKIKNDNDIKIIYNEIENLSKSIEFFYYPIEFSNKELFYYKLYALLIMGINEIKNNNSISDKIKNDYIMSRSVVAKLVMNKKILENKKIINNEDKMNILILLILYDILDDNGETVNFNRLLQTEPVDYQELIKYIKDKNIGIITMFDNKSKLNLKNRLGESGFIESDIKYYK